MKIGHTQDILFYYKTNDKFLTVWIQYIKIKKSLSFPIDYVRYATF